jgi:hypothetical protein
VGANNLVTYTQQPPQVVQAPQHGPQVPSQALMPAQQMHMMQPQRPPMHWSQVSKPCAWDGTGNLHLLSCAHVSWLCWTA